MLLGVAGSMRGFTPGAALAVRGRLPEPLRRPAVAAAALEYAYDKTPVAPRRTLWWGLYGRALGGALAGGIVAGAPGALAGGAAGYAGTFATYEARRRLGAAGVPDVPLALAEDAAAIALALTATAPRRRRR